MVFYTIYTSQPTQPITPHLLEEIRVVSAERNLTKDISGILLGIEGKFMQFLEGGESEVSQLMDKLRQDKRHENLTQWVTGFSNQRVFKEWSMASWMLEESQLKDLSALPDIHVFLKNPTHETLPSRRFLVMMNDLLKTWISHDPGRAAAIES